MTVLTVIAGLIFIFAGFAVIDHFCIGSRRTYDATGEAGNEFWILRNRKLRDRRSERQ